MYNIKPNFENIELVFKEFLELPIWICWKEVLPSEADIEKAKVLMKEIKPIKMPINPHNGTQAKTNDESTWGTYWVAKSYYLSLSDSLAGLGLNYYGKGVYPTGLLPFDLDSIKDEVGEIKLTVKKIIYGLDSFTEVTPSGKGCRVYVKSNLKGGRKTGIFVGADKDGKEEKQNIEFFGEGNHYVTITGVPMIIDGVEVNPKIEKRTKMSIEIFEKVFPPRPKDTEVKEKDVEITDSFIENELINIGLEYKREWGEDQSGKSGIKFKIACPWGSEEGTAHASGQNTLGDAFVFIPDDHRRPWFHCSHATCKDKYSWEDFCKKVFGYVLSDGSLRKNIRAWIHDHPGEVFSNHFIDNEFHVYAESEKTNRRRILCDCKDELLIEQLGRAGEYRVISTKVVTMALKKNVKSEFKINLPLNINALGSFPPEKIVLIQGDVNAGKTAFNFSLIPLNYRVTPIRYYSNSELDPAGIELRMSWLFTDERPMEYWQNEDWLRFQRIEIDTEFADVIAMSKNSIIICDYFDASEDYTKAARLMSRIHDKTQSTGNMVIVSVQINPNKESKDNFELRAYGGASLAHRPSTVFNLVKSSGFNTIYVQKFKQPNIKVYKLFYDHRWCRPFRVYYEGGVIKPTTDFWEHRDDNENKYSLSDDVESHGNPVPGSKG